MTAALFTTDTELSFMLHRRGLDPLENLRIAVMGEVADGAWGIGHQMGRLDAHGLKGVFFVEALSSYLFGIDVLKRVVNPILEAGHDVQLHLHTEWLRWIEKDIVGERRGTNIADFALDDQRRVLEAATEALTAAGAPKPTAFRAGNYGANNDTLKALAALGLTYDSSYNVPYLGGSCRIEAESTLSAPVKLDDIVEIPITFFEDYPGHTRALQLCAASLSEFRSIFDQVEAQGRPTVVIVSHSFELLNVKRTRANRMLVKRFDEICGLLESQKSWLTPTTFADLDRLDMAPRAVSKPLMSNPVRTAWRMIEQSVGSYLYDRA